MAALHLQPCRLLSDVLDAALAARPEKYKEADTGDKLMELRLPTRPEAGRSAEHYGL